MLALSLEGDHRRPLPPALAPPAPGRHPMLRAAPGVRPVQLLDRLPPRPPGPPALAHLEVLVTGQRQRDWLHERLRDRPEFVVTLEVAVPMWMHRWRGARVDQQIARARSLGAIVAAHGDKILFRSKSHAARYEQGQKITDRTPSSAETFNALAEGVALLALLAEGGVDLFDRHWHDGCKAASIMECTGAPR